eukprot:2464134-Pyramimonas_sp.AAC.1
MAMHDGRRKAGCSHYRRYGNVVEVGFVMGARHEIPNGPVEGLRTTSRDQAPNASFLCLASALAVLGTRGAWV